MFKVPAVPDSPIENELALNSTFKILEEGEFNILKQTYSNQYLRWFYLNRKEPAQVNIDVEIERKRNSIAWSRKK